MANFGEFLFGNDTKMKAFNKDALAKLMQLIQNGGVGNSPLYQQGSNFLQSLYSNDPEGFKHFEAPFVENFEQNIAPGIAERFTGGLGYGGTGAGAYSSSALQNSLAQAGRGLQTDLASLRGGLQMQGLSQGLNYAQAPYQELLNALKALQGQYYEIPGQEGLVQGAVKKFAQGAGMTAGASAGGI
jgi:hypothetical protein